MEWLDSRCRNGFPTRSSTRTSAVGEATSGCTEHPWSRSRMSDVTEEAMLWPAGCPSAMVSRSHPTAQGAWTSTALSGPLPFHALWDWLSWWASYFSRYGDWCWPSMWSDLHPCGWSTWNWLPPLHGLPEDGDPTERSFQLPWVAQHGDHGILWSEPHSQWGRLEAQPRELLQEDQAHHRGEEPWTWWSSDCEGHHEPTWPVR